MNEIMLVGYVDFDKVGCTNGIQSTFGYAFSLDRW
jgi:hypothetical protein